MSRLRKSVVLIGMMGAGKSAVGAALARQLAVPFVDTDDEIERAADRTISEIFAHHGEAFFRARETEVLTRLLRGTPSIMSTGGGAFLAAHNREVISRDGVSVWLRADLETLWQRVRHKNTRPLLRTENPRAALSGLLETRSPIYAKADLVVDSRAGQSIDAMARHVCAALAARPDVLET